MASRSSARVPERDNRSLTARELKEKYNSYINADPALVESRRWIEEVTRRGFKSDDFRESLADGIVLCELIEIVGGVSLGRINRIPTAYAGIDNINLFFKACEGLGLKKLHLFDTADLQEVTPGRGDSISSRAKETQRRLQNVAITILWLSKAAHKRGYQGPALDFSCFHHLLPEVHFKGKKDRGTRKRHSLGDVETKSRSTENVPSKKRDRVFDKIDIKDRKEKFRNLENEAKKKSTALELNRRKSTGGILKRIKDNHWENWDKVEGTPSNHKETKQLKSTMPDPKFHEKQEMYNRREKQAEMESAVLEDKTRRKGSGSERMTSPPPISLGRRVEVDLKEKQKKFEGLDRHAEQQSAVLSGKTRSVSWGPGEIRQALKKQKTPVDVAFKEKHKNYEELQRQATTESAVLQGKLRPQFDRTDAARPEKVPLRTTTSDVKLREKQKSFEQLDYQAQREKAILEGNLRLSPTDNKEKKGKSVVIPKREQIKLDEKKAAFERLDRQAEQDTSVLRGQYRPSLTETDGHKRSSKVDLPRESNVGLLEKQRTFEDMDYKARKESETLQKNKRKSFGSPVKEPMPLSTSTRPQLGRFQSPSDRQWDTSVVRRQNQLERSSRPVSNYYEYSSFNDHPESDQVMEYATSEGRIDQVSVEEPMQSAPSKEAEAMNYHPNQTDFPKEDEQRAAENRRREYSDYAQRRYEESRRGRSSVEEPSEIDVSDAKNLSYRDMVRAPRKKSRETFIRETNNIAAAEEMPWRKEVREVKDKRHLSLEEEQNTTHAARPSSPRSELGKAQYLELVVPPSKKAVDSFTDEREAGEKKTEEMPWRKEVKEIRRSLSGEDPPVFMSYSQAQPAEVTRIRAPSLKTRDAFLKTHDDKQQEEMPWRKEVRELKGRPRTEDDEEYQDDSPPPEVDFSTAPNLRKLSYKEFNIAPSRKRRDVFQPDAEKDKDKEEMPWRKEVREIKRTPTEEEEEHLQKSSATFAQSSPEHDFREPAYHELVAQPSRKARDNFVPYEEKQKEEMPWRKEVREIKRTITDDEQIPRSTTLTVHSSPEDQKDLRKFSYRDFIAKPRKKSEGFLPSEEKEKEEMPWRKEVRELRERSTEDEQIRQSSRSEVESAPNGSWYRGDSYASDSSRSGSYPDRQNMSYKDFVCPPSKANEQQGPVRRKSTKVQDLTQKFATIEREKNLPKESGPPSRKSLVDVAELKRIERDMKTRSWHGFPTVEYDSDDDYDVGYRPRKRSQEEREERLREQHHRENVSGLQELDDVFQDPEGYFDQIQGPPPEKNIDESVRVQYKAPPREEHDERREQVVTVRSTNDYGQPSLYAAHRDDYYQKNPVSNQPLHQRKPSDDRVVVMQSWIQPNRVELAEAHAPSGPERLEKRNVNQEYIPRGNGPYAPDHYRNERQYREYEKNEPYKPSREDQGNRDNLFSKPSDTNEEICFIEESEYPRQNQPYLQGYSGYREQNQAPREYRMPTEIHSDPRDREDQQRSQQMKMPAKDSGAMVFGGPIVVTARRSQQPEKPEVVRDRGTHDFVPAEVRSYESRVVRDDMDFFPAEERSYNNRDNIKSRQEGRETIENARRLVLQDIKNIGKKDAVEPPEETRTAYRPQVFGVFARTDPNENQQRDDLHERQSSEAPLRKTEDSFQETRGANTRYLNENEEDNPQDWKTLQSENDKLWYAESQPQHRDESYGYENSVLDQTELHPTVVSMVESQTRQWGSGAFDESPQKDEQRTGRRRVMNFSNDHDDDVFSSDNKDDVFQTAKTEPVPVEMHEADRRREQKEKEEMVRKQLRDAEYREKYRKEFEEKNRKQREKSNYLMSLQMRAAMGSGEDVDYDVDTEDTTRDREFQDKQQQSQDGTWKTDTETEKPRLNGSVKEEDLIEVDAAEDYYWHSKMETNRTELQSRDVSRHERPRRKKSEESQLRINGSDFVGEEDIVRREHRDFEHETRLRKLKAEEELMAQEADRLMKEKAALKQKIEVEEPIVAPVEKPPVEFTINEEALKSLLVEDKKEENFYDENRNRDFPKTRISGQKDLFYNDEEYPPQVQDKGRQYSDKIKSSKPQAEVVSVNGHHHDSDVHPKGPAEVLRQNGDPSIQEDFSGYSGTDPEENGFEGYSIYETFIHGESNHVICMSCGTSIEKSEAMYIAELDRYWHVNCFSCVVCRAWFGHEYSPVLQITNSMLHCERCYITSEGERCTEV